MKMRMVYCAAVPDRRNMRPRIGASLTLNGRRRWRRSRKAAGDFGKIALEIA